MDGELRDGPEPPARPRAIVVADAHLGEVQHDVQRFVAFLRSCAQVQGLHALYILGDLFTLWIGTPRMQLSFHQPVLEALHTLREHGIRLTYVEGNRDYFLAPHYLQAPFDEIASDSTRLHIGNRHFYLAHGDLVNTADRPYRVWRAFSRNRLIYAGFLSLPRSLSVRLAHSIERKLRGTNRKNKAAFPSEICDRCARQLWQAGYDTIILGHFHEARHQCQMLSPLAKKKHLYVLPAWKDTSSYLAIGAEGQCSFHYDAD
jgi:UDP-2,3-diacylglucosamine hydrolase